MAGDILARIKGPSDLKGMGQAELEALASEIRSKIIETVSANGGHLSASLGAVELAIAIHSVFNSPSDKIIWDVGHQSYAHKLLTGRAPRFDSLRCFEGISGFPSREESEHDPFGTGHASTSVSAALGFAKARDITRGKERVIAVIGDGSIAGGMAFEALNHAGHDGSKIIVILNDNSMSIAPNVGALSAYLSRIRSDPTYFKLKAEFEHAVRRIPVIGEQVRKAVERLKDSVKYMVLPGMLFEELGFTYLGPVDGHSIASLRSILMDADNVSGPVIVHVVTKKGKGYKPAELDPERFHGTGPFNKVTGEPISSPRITFSEVFGQTLLELAKRDERVVAITAAMGDGTGLREFARKLPERFFDVGICEQHAVTFAAGLAAGGLKPVVAIYSTFLQRAFDQIVHDVCLQKLPVVFAIDRAGIVGDDGPTHHGLLDISFLRVIPNLVIMAPRDGRELAGMLEFALRSGLPCAIRYPKGAVPDTSITGIGLSPVSLGSGEVLRYGEDAAILAIGSMVHPAYEAAVALSTNGFNVSVIDSRFVKPLDEELITKFARLTGCLVTVEENTVCGGFGSAVLECLNREGLGNTFVKCLGISDEFVAHGKAQFLLSRYGLSRDGIASATMRIIHISRERARTGPKRRDPRVSPFLRSDVDVSEGQD